MAEQFAVKGFRTHDAFKSNCPSAVIRPAKNLDPEDVRITKEDFRRLLEHLGIFTNENEYLDLLLKLDPLFCGEISALVLEQIFSSEIIT